MARLFSKLRQVFLRFKQQIYYLLFGGLTTLVDWTVYFLLIYFLQSPYTLEIAKWSGWLLSVIVAYVTNRTWVFHSTVTGAKNIFQELLGFMSGRLLSGVIDYLFLVVTVRLLGWSEVWMKLVGTVFVIVFNYFFSKWVIFKESQKTGKETVEKKQKP